MGGSSVPFYTAFVGAQRRIYFQAQNDGNPGRVRWFDLTTRSYVRGTGSTFGMDAMDGVDSGIIFWVPGRDLLIALFPFGGQLRVQWMEVGADVDQPSLGGTATLSQPMSLATPWSAGCWCPGNARIIIAGVAGDTTAAFEIEMPADLRSLWPISRAPFGPGQSFAPADPAVGYGLSYKKFHYDERVRSIVYMPFAANGSSAVEDTVWVYRPRGT